MRIKLKIIFIVLLIFVIGFISLHILVNIKGKALLAEKLSQAFGREVKIESLNTSFPFGLRIKNIEAAGLFHIDELIAGGGAIDIFRRSFKLSSLKLTRPVINLLRPAALKKAYPLQPAQPIAVQRNISAVAQPKKFSAPSFFVGKLVISDGLINFTDKSLGDRELKVKIKEINFKVYNLSVKNDTLQASSFKFSGKVPWQEGQVEGKIEAEGWCNLARKDMKAMVKINDIDGVYLYPYYAQWLDLEKVRIQSAKLQFRSDISSENNNLAAKCHLELSDVVRKSRPVEELSEREERMADAVMDAFKVQDQGKIILDFTYRTKMDRPEFKFGVVKSAFENKLALGLKENSLKLKDLARFPAKLLKGTAKGATDLSKAAISGTASLGRGIKEIFAAAFKKEPKEKY
ncbi:MAG: DUF748 domain-containing protein [Candidatus Omnitrophica bacterium]|jgi:hypothetical protein|nr:DUF748 domain-containing protein [Candidatus Omnitrophota bacterium]